MPGLSPTSQRRLPTFSSLCSCYRSPLAIGLRDIHRLASRGLQAAGTQGLLRDRRDAAPALTAELRPTVPAPYDERDACLAALVHRTDDLREARGRAVLATVVIRCRARDAPCVHAVRRALQPLRVGVVLAEVRDKLGKVGPGVDATCVREEDGTLDREQRRGADGMLPGVRVRR
jgi:hypothetical protein